MARQRQMADSERLARYLDEAFDWLWANNLENRAEDWNGQTYYITASDLESQVRAHMCEDLEGAARGSRGRGCYGFNDVRVSGLGPGGLFSECRRYLLGRRDLDRHNFGRGHVSGERFRPHGEPLSPQEERTLARKQREHSREKPVHYADGERYPHRALCSAAARATVKGKRGTCSWRQPKRSTTRTTKDAEKVTCKRCQKLLKSA